MLHHTTDTTLADSQRACLRLVERLAEKYGGEQKHEQDPDRFTRFTAKRVNIEAIRAAGYKVEVAPPAPKWLRNRTPYRSMFDPGKVGGRPVNPKIKAATLEALEMLKTFPHGKPPVGTWKRLAAKWGLCYGSLVERIVAERRWLEKNGRGRKECAA